MYPSVLLNPNPEDLEEASATTRKRFEDRPCVTFENFGLSSAKAALPHKHHGEA